MRIILIGNYLQDKQESMQRFEAMLAKCFVARGIQVDRWRPVAILGAPFLSTNKGAGKWFGYVDKWFLFPLTLCFRRLISGKKNDHYHVCDHSNSPYLQYLPKHRTVITCHDVIAIKSGLGFADTYVHASRMGTILQKWILRNLRRAPKLAAVSQFTLDQLMSLAPDKTEQQDWRVVSNGFNESFYKLDKAVAAEILLGMGIAGAQRYLLHVGSDLPRKNRLLLLHMVVALGSNWEGIICFAGNALDEDLAGLVNKLGLQDRVISIIRPDHRQLLALYRNCEAFIFPSFSEGFGWPVIEAQACGAPVIASSIQPMPEVGGEGALYANPFRAQDFAKAFITLKIKTIKNEVIRKGYTNTEKFKVETMADQYLKFHLES